MPCSHKARHRRGLFRVSRNARRATLWTCAACGAQVADLRVGGKRQYRGPEAEAGDWRAWIEAGTLAERHALNLKHAAVIGFASILFLAVIGGCYLAAATALARWTPPVEAANPLTALPQIANEEVEAEARQLFNEQVPAYIRAGQRINDIAWRMLVAGADECAGSAPRIGITFTEENIFPDDAAYRAVLGHEASAIAFVAAGSPAEKAGLRQGDVVYALGTTDVAKMTNVHDISRTLYETARVGEPYTVVVRRYGMLWKASPVPVKACPHRIVVSPSSQRNALTDRKSYITVLRGLAEGDIPDDEIAYVIGHEIGHMLVDQPDRRVPDWVQLAAGLVRGLGGELPEGVRRALRADRTWIELASDAIGARLAAKAGYNPSAFPQSEHRFADSDYEAVRAGDLSHPGSALRIVSMRKIADSIGAPRTASPATGPATGPAAAAVLPDLPADALPSAPAKPH